MRTGQRLVQHLRFTIVLAAILRDLALSGLGWPIRRKETS